MDDVLERLARDLATPPAVCDLATLAEVWQMERLVFVCERPTLMEDFPELSMRVRGAFGRALHDLPARTWRSGRPRPRAWDVLFAPLAHIDGDELPKPAVVRAHVERDRLIVELRIFGEAVAWVPEAFTALVAALERGIALKSEGRQRVALVILEAQRIASTGVDLAPPPGLSPTGATLDFRTPVVVRQGGLSIGAPVNLLAAVPRRLAALARWQGFRLLVDHSALDEAIGHLARDDRETTAHVWRRWSIRGGDRAIPTGGWIGRLRLAGPVAPLVPWLVLAAETNIGSHAGLGHGWYELTLW